MIKNTEKEKMERAARAAKAARIGDRAVSIVGVLLALILLLFGTYSIWDNVRITQSAFIDPDLLKYKPSVDDPKGFDLEGLQKINKDVKAWLTVDDTHIDYPVVYGESNLKYINTDIYGNFSLPGSIFLDAQNTPDFSDQYCMVFGHHMDNGAMFGDVLNFVNADYFNSHRTGTLYLRDRYLSVFRQTGLIR